jgi:acetoin utilization deacetylase AcuC-like enzyme
MLAIYTHSIFRRHETGAGHPESVDRLDAALEGVTRAGLGDSLVRNSPLHAGTLEVIHRVHSESYEAELERAASRGERIFHSYDNPISHDSHAAAVTAVSEVLHAADAVWTSRSARRAFVIARPPGHHAERTTAMGFCFFNTIACAAEHLLASGLERVFIFDWDVHHGNGTQHLFENRNDVFYASVHRYPFYPGTGAAVEIGSGAGRGFTRNFPLGGASGDSMYLSLVENDIVPLIDDFRPQAILISAGFDAHYRDPLGGMRVTEEAFGEMTRRMVESAEKHCEGRLVSLLEGGYDAEGLAASVAGHVTAMNPS